MNDYSKQRLVEFRSEDKAWVTGGKGTIPFEGFVETKIGELGHRAIIKGFQLVCIANVTVTTAALKGEDLYRFFRAVTVEQKDNVRRYDDVPGDALRILSYEFMGPQRTKEHPDVAIGPNQDIVVSAYLPMSKAHLFEPDDTAMAADVFKQLTIKMAQPGDLSLGTSVVVINSATYYVIAECYEEEDVVQHAVDVISIEDMESRTESKIVVGGKLTDLLAMAPGAGGGQTMGGIATVRVLELQRDELAVNPDVCDAYARRRGITQSSRATKGTSLYEDPFTCNAGGTDSVVQAIPILASHGNKIAEDPVLGIAHVKFRYNDGTLFAFTGNPRLIKRVLMPTNPKLTASIGKKFGAKGTRPKAKRASSKGVRPDAAAYFPKQLTK